MVRREFPRGRTFLGETPGAPFGEEVCFLGQAIRELSPRLN